MLFEYATRVAGFDVVNNNRRTLPPEARIRDNNRLPVRADLQVLQERAERCNVFTQLLVSQNLVSGQVDRDNACRPRTVIAMVDRPEPVESVNRDTKRCIKTAPIVSVGRGRVPMRR